MHSDLPATKMRGYVQLNQGTDANGKNTIAPDPPQFLGATIVASKDRPVRILFRNKLAIGADGNLFLPADTTMMGAGMGPDMGGMKETDSSSVFDGVRNPMCGMPGPKPMACFTENRATLHLHGGITPWISDGTPHQWTVPAGETTMYQKGVSVSYVPDMWYDATGSTIAECAGQNTCSVAGATNDPGAGALTFYYTNQQSARLLFYHDHSWGITRLNVYAGEAAGYLVTDKTEQALTATAGRWMHPIPRSAWAFRSSFKTARSCPTRRNLPRRTPPGTRPAGAARAISGTTTFTCLRKILPTQRASAPMGGGCMGRGSGPRQTRPQLRISPFPTPITIRPAILHTAPNGFCEPP